MSNELASPIRNAIKRAAENKVEGPAAKIKRRMTEATDEILVVADCSGSMNESIGGSDLSKYEHLRIALKDVFKYHPRVRIIAFNYRVVEVTAKNLPGPDGGTNLAGALDFAAQFKPRKTIIISDGLPDSEAAATSAADRLTGIIDTIYCGPDGHPAITFLRSLSRETGGVSVQWDGYTQVSTVIRGLLPAPADTSVAPADNAAPKKPWHKRWRT